MRPILAPAAATYARRDSAIAGHQAIAFTIASDFVGILLSLPLIEANADEPVDLWTLAQSRPIQGLLEHQNCIRRVLFSFHESGGPPHTAEIGCPIPVYGRYREVIHLGLRETADAYYPRWLAQRLGLNDPSPDFRLRREEETNNDSPGTIVLDIQPGDVTPDRLRAFGEQASTRATSVCCLRRGISTAFYVERVADRLARASLFVGRYSWRACIAILAGAPAVILTQPQEKSRLRLLIPPDQRHLWQVEWTPGGPLPDPIPFLTEIARFTDKGC